MDYALSLVIFLGGIILIVKGGDWFVDAASYIAEVSGVPKLIVGATIVSLATTLPEMLVSAMAAIQGKIDMSVGNAVGSVTANLGLIMAVSVICMPVRIRRGDYLLKSVLMLAAAGIVAAGGREGAVGLRPSLVLLAVFALFLYENLRSAHRSMRCGGAGDLGIFRPAPARREIFFQCVKFTAGAVAVVMGADLLVDNGTLIAQALGAPESVIALTFVALGTSLPELVTAITSLVKGHGALSLGNVIGANLFNLVLVSGVSVTLAPFSIPQAAVIAGHNASLVLDLPVMLLVMLLLTVPALVRGKLSRVQGLALLAVYGAFCAVQFTL